MSNSYQGYQYDIFISYRQNDNQDGWVTQFVEDLQKELISIFKEDISIYFDSDPQHGLQETHDVDGSLTEKVKCLVFIPIISQTYCDPDSFAWRHEFLSFLDFVKQDDIGLNVRLSGGNMAKRVLPIRIHEIDEEDTQLFEEQIQGTIRPVEFIFKDKGVNRPLLPSDERSLNLNKTYYRDQVNKTANAIKEIVRAIKKGSEKQEKVSIVSKEAVEKIDVSSRKKYTVPLVSMLIIVSLVLLYFIFNNEQKENSGEFTLERSIAVMPFEDNSPNQDQEWFGNVLAEEIHTSLNHINELKVSGMKSSFSFKDKEVSMSEMGKELGVKTILGGSVSKIGSRFRIAVWLANIENGKYIWSDKYDRDTTDILSLLDEVSNIIVDSLTERFSIKTFNDVKIKTTTNPEAFKYFQQGRFIMVDQYYGTGQETHFMRAKKLFWDAIALDSNYALAYAGLADLWDTYRNWNPTREADSLRRSYSIKAYQLDPNSAWVNYVRGVIIVKSKNPNEDSVYYFNKRALQIEPNDAHYQFIMGFFYRNHGLINRAIPYLEKARELDPLNPSILSELGLAYEIMGDSVSANQSFEKALSLSTEIFWLEIHLIRWLIVNHRLDQAQSLLDEWQQTNPKEDLSNLYQLLHIYQSGDSRNIELIKNPYHKIYGYVKFEKRTLLYQLLEDQLALDNNIYVWLKSDHIFDVFRNDPEFIRIMEKAKTIHELNLRRFPEVIN